MAERARRVAESRAAARRSAASRPTPQSAPAFGPAHGGGNLSASLEFGYPFRDMGKFMFAVCAFLSVGARYAGLSGLTNAFFNIIAQGIVFIYFLDIIAASAAGRSTPPEIPNASNLLDIFVGFAGFIIVETIASGPSYLFQLGAKTHGLDPGVATAGWFFFRLIGIFYFPMACIYLSQTRTIAALNPLPVIKSVLTAPSAYFTLCFCMFIVFVPGMIIGTISMFVPENKPGALQMLLMTFDILKIYVMFMLGRAFGSFMAE